MLLPLLGDTAPTIANLVPGETVRVPAIVVRGKSDSSTVRLRGVEVMEVPVVDGAYAGVVELKPGRNMIFAASEEGAVKIRVNYTPMKTDHVVRPLFLISSDEGPSYLGATKPTSADIAGRIDTAVKLMQAFSAEALHDAGYERKAFHCEVDAKGRAKVDFVRVTGTGNELRALDGNALYSRFYGEVGAKYDLKKTKMLAFMGFTGYDPATRKVSGHTALGGGSLALFASGSMRHWPTSIADVPRAMNDVRRVDPAVEFDDSGYRGTAWGNAATTIGACLHELGHTFGLPHTTDRRCIMSRGFDNINRMWMLSEGGKPVTPESAAHWDPFYAARLDAHPFFSPVTPPSPVGEPPSITVEGGKVVFRGTGLKAAGYWAEGEKGPIANGFAKPNADRYEWDEAELRSKINGAELRLYAIDRYGREVDVTK